MCALAVLVIASLAGCSEERTSSSVSRDASQSNRSNAGHQDGLDREGAALMDLAEGDGSCGTGVKMQDATFKTALATWFNDKKFAIKVYGHISDWDVSRVTNMRGAFLGRRYFDEDISRWCTDKVRDMSSMFYGATRFNVDLGDWNVSEVRDMKAMFRLASSFNKDLTKWCVQKIPSTPDHFDFNAGFEGRVNRQPKWGTCP